MAERAVQTIKVKRRPNIQHSRNIETCQCLASQVHQLNGLKDAEQKLCSTDYNSELTKKREKQKYNYKNRFKEFSNGDQVMMKGNDRLQPANVKYWINLLINYSITRPRLQLVR